MKGVRVLVVDDEPGIRQSLGGVLEDEGYVVHVAESGEACLEELTRQSYELTLLDIIGRPRASNAIALLTSMIADVGAPTALLGWGQSFVTGYCLPTCYKVPNARIQLSVVVTNKCPWNAYRGFGKDSASFLMDRVMDRIARDYHAAMPGQDKAAH